MSSATKTIAAPKPIRVKRSASDNALSIISYSVAGLFALICFIPFVYVFTYSLTPYADYLQNPLSLIPRNINFSAYRDILNYKLIQTGYLNTIFITLVGTAISVVLLLCTAYPLSKPGLKGNRFFMFLFVFTMYFSGGTIPSYYLMRNLDLINSLWSLILPGVVGAYNVILMRNFIMEIPESLEEAAIIDGANEIQVLIKIVAPLCLPALVTLGLFHAVGAWNSYFASIIYITKRNKWPLQLVLREIIGSAKVVQDAQTSGEQTQVPFTIQMASIMVTTLPIMCVYPFLQKYFMTGLTLGGVKE